MLLVARPSLSPFVLRRSVLWTVRRQQAIRTTTFVVGTRHDQQASCLSSSSKQQAADADAGMSSSRRANEAGLPAFLAQDDKLSAVYGAMNDIAPLSMADTSWDNVGVQLQAPLPKENRGNVVLLCNDLTTAVADEALSRGDVAVIVTYHPIIFRGLKSVTLDDTQQRSLLRLAAANVSVYAAHTSIDACAGGNADWLARIVSGGHADGQGQAKPIEASKQADERHPNAGMGRTVDLTASPVSVDEVVRRVKQATGLSHLIVGLPRGWQTADARLSSIAVAAGSAGSIVAKSNAQAWVTGELSHHEALAAVEKGIVVILTLHGNSERAYLRQVLQKRLQSLFDEAGAGLNAVVSTSDREPLQII